MRHRVFRIACVLIGLFGASVLSAPKATHAQTSFFGTPGAVLICINPSIPFVWVRNAPSSYAGVKAVLYPRDYAKLVKNTVGATFDGVQWWYAVSAFPTAARFIGGWVEANAFVGTGDSPANAPEGCPSTTPPAGTVLALKGTVCLKAGVPFIWERIAPSSYAPAVDTVFSSDPCSEFGLPRMTAGRSYYWDGVQWWVEVAHPPRQYSSRAWVEAESLQPMP